LSGPLAPAAGVPSGTGKPASAIAAGIEQQGYTIKELEFDHGRWEIDAYKDGLEYRLKVNPATGKIIKPLEGTQPVSGIIADVEKQGYTVRAVDFDRGTWEIKAYKNGRKYKLTVDASSGKTISSRPDH